MFKYFQVKGKYETIIIAKEKRKAIQEYKKRFEASHNVEVKEITREEAVEQHIKQLEKCAEEYGAYAIVLRWGNRNE